MVKPGFFMPDIQIGAAEGPRQRLVAAAKIEDEGQRIVFLRGLKSGGQRKTFAASR